MKFNFTLIKVFLFALVVFQFQFIKANEVVIGTSTSTTTSTIPAYGFYDYGWSAMIYSAAEIGGPCTITGLQFQMSNAVNYTLYNQTVYMIATTDSFFSATTYINPTTVGATQVYSGNLSCTSAGGFQGITLQTPFNFTGGNLLILWENRDGSYSSGNPIWYSSASSVNKAIYRYQDNSFPTTSGTYSNRPNTKLIYTPANPIDLSVSQWVYPTTGAAASSSIPISIKISNQGSQAQSNFIAKYSIDNGSTWAQQTVTSNLGVGSTMNLTFITPANMSSPGTYQCIAVVNKTGDAVASNDTLRMNITICGGAFSGAYTIGSGASDDFPDIQSAIQAINNCGMAGSIVLKIKPGTYNGQVDITPVIGMSSTKTLTIETYTGLKDVILNNNSTSSDHLQSYTLSFDSVQYVKIKNLTIKTSGLNGAHALLLNKASNNTIENCIIEGENSSTSSSYYFSTIYLNSVTGYYSRQNTFLNNTIKYGSFGVYDEGINGYVYGNKYISNQILDYRNYGMYISYNDSLKIKNNTIKSTNTSQTYNIYLYYCKNNMDISANKLEVKYTIGLYLYYCQSSSSTPSKIYNNFIYGYPETTSSLYFVYSYQSNYIDFEYNSYYMTNPNSLSSTNYLFYSYYDAGLNIRNNSMVNEANGYSFYLYQTTINSFDYNNFYTNGTYLAYYNGTRANLAAVKAYNSTNLNSVSTNGVYYSSDNLHSNSSGLNGLGTALSSITVDIDGQTRSTTTPDIGADEFDILNYDGGLLGFTGLTNQCSGTITPIYVNFKNFGSQAITSAYLSASLGTANLHQSWTGYLSPGSSTNIFLGIYTFSSDTVYNFVATIDSVNHVADLNDFNDTTYLNGYRTSLSGSFIIGNSTSADFTTISDAVAAMNQYGICGPVVFNIEPGTYSGNYTLSSSISGVSAINTVTFRSATGDTADVHLVYNATSTTDNFIFKVDNYSHFKFIGLTFLPTSANYNSAFNLNYSSYIEIDSCLIVQPQNNTSSYGYSIYSIYSSHISVKNSSIINGSYGVYSYGSSFNYNNNIAIENNIFNNCTYYSIYLYYSDTVSVKGNKITTISNTISTLGGVYIYYCNYKLDFSSNNVIVEGTNNVYALYMNYVNYNSSSSTAQINVYNNFLRSKSTSTSGYAYSIYSRYGYYHKYYFNTIKSDGGYTTTGAAYLYNLYNNSVVNNIFYADQNYAIYRYGGSIVQSDYNNYYTNGTYLIRYTFTNYTTLSYFVSSYGYDTHSKSVNPGFLGANNLHIFSQALNDAGTPYAGVTKDIDGETRSTYLPDIGADEYSLLARDVFPYAVNSPANPAAIGQNAVKVAIKNQGTSTLFSSKIFAQLDGGAIDSTYWVGSLGFLDIDSMISMNDITLTSGAHSMKVWTKLPNGAADLNPSNDTLIYNFNAIAKPIIDYAPLSLTDSILTCSGTKNESITVYNRGSANLTISVPANAAAGDSIKILSLLTGYSSTYYNNAKSLILAGVPNVYFTELTTYDAVVLAGLLVNQDIVLIPRITSTSSTVLNAYTAFAPVLQNFVNNGGSVIFMGSQSTSANIIFNTGLFTGYYYSYLSSGNSIIANQPNHPIFNGLSTSSLVSNYYYALYTISNTDATVIASYSSYPTIIERTVGNGKVLLIGMDDYYYGTQETALTVNMINYMALQNDFVVNQATNQTIVPGDSSVLNLSFSASGLTKGWHTEKFVINHNDQSLSSIEVPCSLYVAGTPDIGFSKTTHSFGAVYVGTSVIDSIYFYNNGCDDLYITGVASNNSYLIPLNTNDTITPGDSAAFYFKFQPQATGSYVMTATVYNNDSNYVLTFAGSATPSPALSLNPNPLNVTITNCGDSVIVPVVLTNTGGATLTGNASASGDSLEVLMLTYGAYSTGVTFLADAFDYSFTKYNLTQMSIISSTQLQTALTDMDVVVIPYMNSTAYYSTYASFNTVLQNFVSNGGVIIYAGQYYPNYLTSAGFFTGSYNGYNDYVNVNVVTNHTITNGLTSTTYIGNEDFLYWSFTNTNRTDLITFNGYSVTSVAPYGGGYAIYLGFYYVGSQYSHQVASNALEFAYNKKSTFIDFQNYNFTLAPTGNSTLNVKLKSQGLATGQHIGEIKFNTNIPSNPIVILPCTLQVKNELDATSFLGPDTSYCGPKLLDAGSGYSSYLWNTASASQTLLANTSGFYMVTVTDGGNCSSRDTVLLTINPLPNAVITGLPTSACTNGTPIQMTGTPYGGGFIGTGVSGSTFNPANLSTGPYNITYTYTNSNGCTDTDVKTVTVYNPPTVLLSGLAATYCPQSSASNLIGAPAGGVFSGTGVNGSQFIPTLAGSGNHSVIYTYTDNHGCSNSDTSQTTVGQYVQANITGYSQDMCINDSTVTFVSSVTATTYNGVGVSGNTFSPAAAGVGTHNIYFAYYDNNNCNYQDTLFITVHALPSGVAISGLGSSYCYDEGNISLSGYPLGGTFNGTGITGSTFNTVNAGSGNHLITYNYTDVYGCSNTDTAFVTVNPLPVITFSNINSGYCIDNGLVALSATPAGGTFSGTYVSSSNFDPQSAGVGTHYVSYSYTDNNGCFNSDSIAITVNSLPTASFTGLPSSVCSNSAPITLSGLPLGGTFSGSGMTGNVFNPANAGSGIKQITYTYTDNNGCSDQEVHSTNVVQTQVVNIGADQIINNNTSTQFNPIISGGSGSFTYLWSPANKLVNPNILNPSTVALTQTTTFMLQVTDNITSCVDIDTALVSISGGALTIAINATQSTICSGTSTTIQANGSGGNGTYSYSWSSTPAGFSSNNSSIIVSPTVTTTYSCLVTSGTSTISNDITITVNPSPMAQIGNLNTTYCSNESSVVLTGTPSGGSFTGSGMSGNVFTPASASIGINQITYSVTGTNGCFDTDTILVDVKSSPTAFAGNDTLLPCQNNGVSLGQQPFSGVSYSWYPNFGLNNPAIANPLSTPNYGITYILTATASNGCQATDTVNIGVVGGPNAIVSNDTIVCAGSVVTLNVSGGDTYLWSTGDTVATVQVAPMITTQYFVIATQSNCADLDTITVTVNQPKPHLGKDTIICAGTSILVSPGIFPGYLWSTGDITPFISVDSAGVGIGSKTITVEVTDNFGCTNSDTIVIGFKLCSGIDGSNSSDLAIALFPNPTDGKITLKSTATTIRELNYSIINVTGSIVLQGVMENSAGYFNQQLDLSILSKGVYLLRLTSENESVTLRITLQ